MIRTVDQPHGRPPRAAELVRLRAELLRQIVRNEARRQEAQVSGEQPKGRI